MIKVGGIQYGCNKCRPCLGPAVQVCSCACHKKKKVKKVAP